MHNFKITGLIIAAGFSGRMGAFKPLMKIEGKPFVNLIINKLLEVCQCVTVVTGFNSDEVTAAVTGEFAASNVKIVFNPDFGKGMFTSLQAGLKSRNDADWIIYHFVDQPSLPPKFYTEFVSQIDPDYDWIQPAFKKRNGHPLLISSKLAGAIEGMPADSNLRKLADFTEVRKKIWQCDFEEVLQDIDTPEQYSKLVNQKPAGRNSLL